MKLSATILTGVLVMLLASSGSLHARPNKSVTVLPARGESFCFKVDRNFIGADVEIFDLYGTPVGSTKVMGRRMLIDLTELAPDSYVIRITKGDAVFEYRYIKTSLGLFKL